MSRFLIVRHADDSVRSLIMKGQGSATGTETIDLEREFARESGTELEIMHEFEVGDGDIPSLLDWGEAKCIAAAFWEGYDKETRSDGSASLFTQNLLPLINDRQGFSEHGSEFEREATRAMRPLLIAWFRKGASTIEMEHIMTHMLGAVCAELRIRDVVDRIKDRRKGV